MNTRETLEKLNKGCDNCRVKMCSLCPVGDQKKKLKNKLGIIKPSFWNKLWNLIKKN